MEYLYSDEGQIGWLKGYCHPIRFQDLVGQKGSGGRAGEAAAGGGLCQGGVSYPRSARTAKGVITTQWDASSAPT